MVMFIPTVCQCDPHTIIWYDYSHLCHTKFSVYFQLLFWQWYRVCPCVYTNRSLSSVWYSTDFDTKNQCMIPSSAFQLTWVVKLFNFKCICCQIYMLENSVLFISWARKFIDWQLIKNAGTIIIISLMGTIQSGDVSRYPWPKVSG